MNKLSGWQKAGLIAGLGCLSIIGVVVIGVVVAIVWARATIAELGDTTPTEVQRTIGLRGGAASDQTGTAAPPVNADAQPLRQPVRRPAGSDRAHSGERADESVVARQHGRVAHRSWWIDAARAGSRR